VVIVMDRALDFILRRLVKVGSLAVTNASGRRSIYGDGSGPPLAMRFTSRAWQWSVLLDPELRFGEAYMEQGLVVEQGSIADILDLLLRNASGQEPTAWTRFLRYGRRLLRGVFKLNNLLRARRNAVHHYNIDSRLYRLFLDSDLQYSCAYFESPSVSIDDAQRAKKRHIAGKLLLDKPGLRVLDIGCGFGGLGLDLARAAGASVVGVNLSDEQIRIARERAAAEGLPCDFRLQDYRNVMERFDRIVSVGMFEHVGKAYYPAFFKKAHALLNDDGVMLLHTIGRWDAPSITNAWVWKYIFPGGYTPTLSELTPVIEKAGFVITDIEVLRLHYAMTLRHWRERFLARREDVLKIFDERFIRMWEFYLAGFEASFHHFGLVVFQIQLAKRVDAVPLTRNYMYDPAQRAAGLAAGRAATPLRIVKPDQPAERASKSTRN
jgi:cyclopropane-fatty-acyl-phospholipid synthase